MYSPERIAGLPPAPVHKPEEFEVPDDEDDDAQPEAAEPVQRIEMPDHPTRLRSSAVPTLSEADQAGLAFWKSLNEAEQRWLTGAGEAPRKLLKWASRLETSPKVLKIRSYVGEGDERKVVSTIPVKYVEVTDQEIVTAFTLTPDSLPPEFDFGSKLELEFEDKTKKVLSVLTEPADKFPFPRLVFFPDDEQG